MHSIEQSKKYKEERKAQKMLAKQAKIISKQKEKSQLSLKPKIKSKATTAKKGKTTKTTTKKLKAILLDLVLIYGKVKHTDSLGMGRCCTCRLFGRWDTMQGGHFIPQSKGLATKFELDNINLQCAGCNGKGNQGEQYKHGLYIDSKYGDGRADELHAQARNPKQWKVWELEEAIQDVEDKLVALCITHSKLWTSILVEYITKNSQRKSNCKSLLAKIVNETS